MPYGRINRVRLDHRFNKYENEASVAAYLLFMDQAAFRQFMLSYPILDAFRTWKEHGGFNTRIEDAFELLRGASNSEDIFPPSMEEIVKKYRRPQNDEIPEDNKFDFCPIRSRWSYRKNIREDWLLAALLRHLVQCMGDALSCTPDEEKVKLQKIANSKFADSLGLQTPITHQITDVIQPVWGPFETFGEEPFEEYNRAYMVLRRLMHVVQTDGLWAFEFLCDQPFRSCITPRDAIPWWMLGPKSPGALEQPLPVPVELPSCNYRIRISQHGSIMEQQLQKHEEAFLKPRGLRLPRSDEIIRCQADPRLFEERDDFLDALRMQLNLAKMRVSFSAVRLYLRNQGQVQVNSAPWRSLYPPGLPPAPATTPENSSADHSLLKASAARNSISAVSPTRINPRDLSIRFTQYRNESAVSAYVLSSDVGKFRRFLLSYPVLDAFCVWKKEGGLNTDIEAALKLLDRTQPLDEAFPVEIHAIFAKYGKQFDENGESVEDFDFWDEHDTHGRQIHVLASVLRHPVVCSGPIIENGDKYHPFAFQFFQPIANGEFRNSTGRSIPVLHDHTKPHSFNRQPISVADVPFWMRSIGNTMVQLQDLVIRKSPGDPPQIYTLRCASKTSAYSTLLERLAASLEAHDYLELPDEFPVPCQPDPGDFETIGQFLNAVAAQLNLAKLGLQFHTVHLLLEDDFKTQLHPNTGNRTWPEIQELIASEPSAEFEYTLRPLGHD
ncbi:hypothetical protein BC567DRAFT_299114 [Phyllosticta citribraziliensis]